MVLLEVSGNPQYVYNNDIEEELRYININNMFLPTPVVPLITFEEGVLEKLPKMNGDDASNIEVSTLENKNYMCSDISERGFRNYYSLFLFFFFLILRSIESKKLKLIFSCD
jgi:hypothetical protein